MAEAAEPQKSALEKALGVFTEVKSGEAPTALLLTLNVFLLLTSYYILKPVREGLILSLKDGDLYKAYLGGAIAAALFIVVPLYGLLVKRLPRNRLVVGVTLFFASHLAVFYVLSTVDDMRSKIAYAFYIWVGVFNMMVVSQFWAFANDIYDEEAGKRLFALIGIGASSGAAIGSLIGKLLIPVFGVYQMLLIAGGILGICAFIFQWVDRRERRRNEAANSAPETEPVPEARPRIKSQLKMTMTADDPDALREAVEAERKKLEEEEAEAAKAKPEDTADFFDPYRMVIRYRYLTLIAAFSLLFTLINTNGENLLGMLVKAESEELIAAGQLAEGDALKSWIGAWYGEFYLYVNILGAILQAFVVSRLVKFGGLKLAFLAYPVLALLDASLLVALPLLAVARIGKIVENASDYSINNTARNMLWLPTTRRMKFVAKQAIDSFFIRLGDVLSGLFVFLLAGMLHFGPRIFAGVNVILAVLTIMVALATMREQPKIRAMRERGELPGDEEPEGT